MLAAVQRVPVRILEARNGGDHQPLGATDRPAVTKIIHLDEAVTRADRQGDVTIRTVLQNEDAAVRHHPRLVLHSLDP